MAGGAELGTGHVSIFPVMTGFRAAVGKEMTASGKSGASMFAKMFKNTGNRVGSDLGKDTKNSFAQATDGMADKTFTQLTREASNAAKQLSKAKETLRVSSGNVRVAELQLAEAIAKNGADSSQAEVAQNRLAAAERKSATASETLEQAQRRLADARKAVFEVAADNGEDGLEWLKRNTEKASAELEAAKKRLAEANESIAKSEESYANAVKRSGANSKEAQRAYARLATAKSRAGSASDKLKSAEEQLATAQKEQAKATEKVNAELKKTDGIGATFAKGIDTAKKALGDFKAKADDALSGLKGVAAAAGIGAAFGAAFSSGLEQTDLTGTLNAKLGDTTAAKEAAKIASSVYAAGWGDSLDQIAGDVSALMQQLAEIDQSADFSALTEQAVALADVFEQDVGGMAVAAGQMIKTGMADNAQEAFDVLTVGFQSGANMADDLLDTFTEYPAQFQKLGLNGKTAMGLISQGLSEGARNADLVADAIKEFSIRAVDGSDTTRQGFEQLGLSADEMAAKFGQGGQSASDAFALVMEKLNGIEDPVERSAAAVNLFGTQAEDLGDALFALDPATAVDALGQVAGAAQSAAAQSEGVEQKWSAFVRNLTTSAGSELMPVIDQLSSFIDEHGAQIGQAISDLVGFISNLVGAFLDLPQPLQIAIAALAVFGGPIGSVVSAIGGVVNAVGGIGPIVNVAKTALSGLGTGFSSLFSLIAANPVVAIIGAIVAALTWFFTQTDTGRAMLQSFFDWLPGAWQSVVDFFTSIGQGIATFFTQTIPDAVQGVIQWFQQLPGNIASALGGMITAIGQWAANLGQSALQAGQQFVTNIITFFTNLPSTIAYWLAYAVTFVVAWAILMGQRALEAGGQFLTNLGTFLAQLPGNIMTWLTETITNVVSWVGQMAQNALDAGSQFLTNAISFFQQLPGNIMTWLSNAVSNAAAWAGQMVGNAINAGSQFLSNVVSFFQQLPGNVASFLGSVISNVVSFAGQMASNALDAGKRFLTNIVDTLSSIPGKVISIGSNIVQGLIDGITGSIGRIGDSLLGGVTDAIDGVKSFLGIHSPSRLMRDEIGMMIGRGAALGIDKSAKYVNESMRDLSDAMSPDGLPDIGRSIRNASGRLGAFATKTAQTSGDGQADGTVINNYYTINIDGASLSANRRQSELLRALVESAGVTVRANT